MSSPLIISAFGFVILCQISLVLSADVVPVLILTGKNSAPPEPVNPLTRTLSSAFTELLENEVGGSRLPIVVFKKPNFCTEDLTQQKLDLGIFGNYHYLPAVEDPLDTIYNLPYYNISSDEKPEDIGYGQITAVQIQDLNNVVESFKNMLANNPDAIAIITGSSCGWSRSERTRRAVTSRATEDEIVVHRERILFYSSKGIYLKTTGLDNFTSLGKPTTSSSVNNGSDVRLLLGFNTINAAGLEVNLTLRFNTLTAGYWYFNNIEYETNSSSGILTSDSTIYFPFNFSYHCSPDSVFYNNVTSLNLTGIQVQIDPITTNTTVKFSDGFDCVGFMSVPIWSGIFVTAILGLLLIWALTMILDIRTMDRFDDPKGKTITIAGAE